MSIDVEYAIKKDIRNNPVVREIDAQQKRDFLRTIGVALMVVATGLFAAWQHYNIVQRRYDIQRIEQTRAAEETVNRKLRLEVERLRSPQQIERVAMRELGMIAPASKDTLVIERARGDSPERAMMARAR
jgi:cell division protein FtsL